MSLNRDAKLPKLNRDVRLMIWKCLYEIQDPRLVEIRTVNPESCDDHQGSCPRYSPSCRPTVVNISRESRAEAHRIAYAANHLLFFDRQPDMHPIYFNPAIDTIYIRNEKAIWIRDFRPVGILTQLQVEWQPERLLHLAIELDPPSRATTTRTLGSDLKVFCNLRELVFVTKHPNDDDVYQALHALNRGIDFMHKIFEYRMRSGRPCIRPSICECKLAIKRGDRLEIVEKRKT